jgi:hypothetical protein
MGGDYTSRFVQRAPNPARSSVVIPAAVGTVAGMRFGDFTPEEIERFSTALSPHQRYITRLATWMEKQRFEFNDPVYDKVRKAREALESINMHIYYAQCTPGSVGTAPKRPQPGTTEAGNT